MIENLSAIAPQQLVWTYESLSALRHSNDEWRYIFMSDDEYRNLKDPLRAPGIYWAEMLSRTHIVCLVSAFKTLRWLEALDATTGNYYGFCTSLRGLIESCADTFYTLRAVPLTVAKDFFVIKEQLNRRSNIFTTHEDLEALLLHYIQATKLSRTAKQNFPDSYTAKSVREYLSAMNDESTQIFLFLHEGQTIVCGDSFEMEKRLVKDLMEVHGPTLSRLLRAYMNNLVSVFLLLNQFEIDNLLVSVENEAEIKQTEAWKEIQEYIVESESLYRDGHYGICP